VGVPSPTIPSFTDGVVVHQADLNALASNLTNLYSYNQAGFRTQRPCVIVKQTSGQSIPNATDTLVNFNTAVVDTDNMWSASTPNRITVQHAGIYYVFAQIRYPNLIAASTSTWGGAYIEINGTTTASAVALMNTLAVANGAGTCPSGSQLANLAAGATIYLSAVHTFGSTQTLSTDVGGTTLGAIFLTPST
jgi:hypothetical protein